MTEQEQLEHAIAAITGQRAVLGDAVVETTLATLRQKLSAVATAAALQQSRPLTVLIADLVGYTALAEARDAEEMHEIMDAYFACWTEAVTAQRGAIEQLVGDSVIAAFGLPETGVADTANAMRAALDVRSRLVRLNETLEHRHGIQLAQRVGIHRGPAVVHHDPDGKNVAFRVTGEAREVAALLEQAAPVGGILVSRETLRDADADVGVESHAAVAGKAGLISVCLVHKL